MRLISNSVREHQPCSQRAKCVEYRPLSSQNDLVVSARPCFKYSIGVDKLLPRAGVHVKPGAAREQLKVQLIAGYVTQSRLYT